MDPTRSARRWRAAAVAVLVVMAAGMLTGCDPDRLGAAAIVDGSQISTDEVQQDSQDYLAIVPDADRSQVQVRILERLILSRVIAKAARRVDASVSKSRVADQREQILQTTKGRKGLVTSLSQGEQPMIVAPAQIDLWVRDQLLYRAILNKVAVDGDVNSVLSQDKATQSLISASKSMSITVNPRYGRWNPRRGIESQVSGGLARTAPQLRGGG